MNYKKKNLYKRISGWGGYPSQLSKVLKPVSFSLCQKIIKEERSIIARGMGRSYGDSANSNTVLQTNYLDNFISFDDVNGLVTVEAGVTLRDILKIIVNKGWFLPVSPGTSFVTVGGAIASDIHGKNHHNAGTFSQHVASIEMLLGTGDVVMISSKKYADLFHATCGGMGLTGIILSATIKLIKIKSSFIKQKKFKTSNLKETFEIFEAHKSSNYSVAWIDCLAKGKNIGRGVVTLGEHSNESNLELNLKKNIQMPRLAPSSFLNYMTMRLFNTAYWSYAKYKNTTIVPLTNFFYPLDRINNWNRLYGKSGFLQYQFVLPKTDCVLNMQKILDLIFENNITPFLAVLKNLGPANKNLLSFPIEGNTLAIDFKISNSTIDFLHKIDNIVAEMGGKIYLSKDSIMKEAIFKKTYTKWQDFQLVRKKYGAINKFISTQSTRLGL